MDKGWSLMLLSLILIISTLVNISASTIPTVNFTVERMRELSKVEFYQTVEFTQKSAYYTILITPLNPLSEDISLNTHFLGSEEDKKKIFDMQVINNGISVENFSFLDPEENPVRIPIIRGTETLLKYRTDQQLKPIGIFSEWAYPFDKYYQEIWNSAGDFQYNTVTKIMYPSSFVITKSYASSPQIFYQPFEQQKINATTGKIISQNNALNITLCPAGAEAYHLSFPCETYDYQGNKFCIIKTLPTVENFIIKKCAFLYNLSDSDLTGNKRDGTTGYYVHLNFERTGLVKFVFGISTFLILFISLYFYNFYRENENGVQVQPRWIKRIFLAYSVTFALWAFQEGIIALTPLSRPLRSTLFDWVIFIPLLFFITPEFSLFLASIFKKGKKAFIERHHKSSQRQS